MPYSKQFRICTGLLLVLFVMLAAGCTSTSNLNKTNDGADHNTSDPIGDENDTNLEDTDSDLPNTDAELDAVMKQLGEMTLEEKIGQLFMVGLDGTTATEADINKIKNDHVGGFILFGRNIDSPEQTAQLIDALKTHNSGPPLFFAVDEEGGSVSRLPESLHTLPAARTIADNVNPNMAEKLSAASGRLLHSLGFNMNFAPVLDVDSNPNNPVIGDRSYGTTPDLVIEYGRSTMSGLKSAGIIPVVKHFPGHGDTDLDSHIGLPAIDHMLDRLEQVEFAPFKEMVTAGEADVVMAGHLVISELDSTYPATLSRAMITGLLREEWGFDGVIVTDDMTMGAITEHYGIGEAAVQAIEAGIDLLLIGHNQELQQQALAAMTQAVDTGKLTEQRIDESVIRLLKLKHKFELNREPPPIQNLEELNEQMAELLAPFPLN